MQFLSVLFGIALGAALGSFLNVVAGRSISGEAWWGKERSRCDHCRRELTARELVPVVSYLIQKGRCPSCGHAIPISYLVVESLGALLGGLLFWSYSPAEPLPLLVAAVCAFSLYLNALTDLKSGYIFDLFAFLPGVAGLLLRIPGGFTALGDGLLGAALGYGLIASIIGISNGVLGKPGMGWGDAHLMAGCGALLGWKMTAVALYLGLMGGGLIVLALLLFRVVRRGDALPLGPFLALGGMASLFVGPALLMRYFGAAPGWPW
ncbi:MAG: A24 family peptidase [Synergistales bacterium]|nr:A24 family peptidase [Synergistales bacterium]